MDTPKPNEGRRPSKAASDERPDRVSDLYQSPFAFTGTILRVMVDITEVSFEDLAAQHEMHARLAMATQ